MAAVSLADATKEVARRGRVLAKAITRLGPLERSLELAHGNGRMGMISPLSLACTSRMAPLRVVLSHQTLQLPSFDIRPNGLSDGVTQRLCFVFSGASANGDQTWSAGYRRWLAPERATGTTADRALHND